MLVITETLNGKYAYNSTPQIKSFKHFTEKFQAFCSENIYRIGANCL